MQSCIAMFLDIIIKELNFIKYSYNLKFYNCVKKGIRYKESKYTKTNKCLYVFKLIKEVKEANKGEGFLYLGLKKGWAKRTSYKENNKGAICKEVRGFINSSLRESNAVLNATGENIIDKLLSEIFNNAEDHSIHNEWYVNGVSYKEIVNGEPIIELNLGILNLGFSISEGFFQTKEKYNGVCNLRYDDTNPTKESQEFVDSIQEDVKWIGYHWNKI